MTDAEIRDELVTMLVAGHETTANTLAWAVERLRRHPELLERLVAEVDAGGKALREATIREVQRTRPVIAFAGRLTREPFTLGGYRLPVDTRLLLAACLTHYDPALFPHPERFDPDRFLDTVPDTYAWIPFGGGIRRCIGATFAHMEMDVVLRVLLDRVRLLPTDAPGEPWAFRGIVWAPGGGGRIAVQDPGSAAGNTAACRGVRRLSPAVGSADLEHGAARVRPGWRRITDREVVGRRGGSSVARPRGRRWRAGRRSRGCG